MKLLLMVLFGIVVLLHLPQEGHGECCTSRNLDSSTCQDCKKKTPCCGKGRCNIFCCNCDGGCRQGWCKYKRDVTHPVLALRNGVRDIITAADKDGDGMMSLEEAQEYLAHRNLPEEHLKRNLQEMDLDGDLYLSPEEIDSDYR